MPIIRGINRYQGQIFSYDEMVSETSMARIIDKFVSVSNTKEAGFAWAGKKM